MSANTDSRKHDVVEGGGNVFADLNLPSSDEEMAKIKLAHAIVVAIDRLGLSQVEAAKRIGVDQPKVSNVVRGRLSGFSIERLFLYLRMLGRDVHIHIAPPVRAKNRGRIKVSNAA